MKELKMGDKVYWFDVCEGEIKSCEGIFIDKENGYFYLYTRGKILLTTLPDTCECIFDSMFKAREYLKKYLAGLGNE